MVVLSTLLTVLATSCIKIIECWADYIPHFALYLPGFFQNCPSISYFPLTIFSRSDNVLSVSIRLCLKYDVIQKLVNHNGNKNRVAKKLGISKRQVDCLIIKNKEKGKSGFVHGNREHVPPKTLDKPISENIILFFMNKYNDFILSF